MDEKPTEEEGLLAYILAGELFHDGTRRDHAHGILKAALARYRGTLQGRMANRLVDVWGWPEESVAEICQAMVKVA